MTCTILSNGPKVMIAAAIASTCFWPSQYSPELAQLTANSIAPIAQFAPGPDNAQIAQVATAQEMISNLRKGGLPVSAIADAMRVERKSIYAWLEGGPVRPGNIQRADQVHSLLTGVPGVDAGSLYRFWNTPRESGETLRDLITAQTIDELKVRLFLEGIRPAVLRVSLSEKKMRRTGTANAFLDEIPEAGISG